MRVALMYQRPGGTGGTEWLAGAAGITEREFTSVANFEKTASIQEQVDMAVNAKEARVRDRGNLVTELTFETTRTFPTAYDAEMWALDYDGQFDRTGTLIMESLKPKGGVIRRIMKNALVHPPAMRVTGATVWLRYRVRGGKITILK